MNDPVIVAIFIVFICFLSFTIIRLFKVVNKLNVMVGEQNLRLKSTEISCDFMYMQLLVDMREEAVADENFEVAAMIQGAIDLKVKQMRYDGRDVNVF